MKFFILTMMLSIAAIFFDVAFLMWLPEAIVNNHLKEVYFFIFLVLGIWFTLPICLIPVLIGWIWYIKKEEECE